MHISVHSTRIALSVLGVVFLLSACATVRPAPESVRDWAQVCYPGSAIKRRVADASAYPEWMIVERGSCLYR